LLARRIFFAVLILGLILAGSAEAARRKKQGYSPPPDRFAEIVIDAGTGRVLSEKNADKRLYPASLTKMMTLYLTFEALEKGTVNRGQRLYVSRHASRQEPSSLNLEEGDTVRLEDVVLGVVTKSANDAAVTLAEALGGSESRFAQMMTRKAQELGMRNTRFVNASGLHNPGQYSSARDMAILSQALLRDFPAYYRIFSTESFYYQGVEYATHNKLMKTYRGMDGIKTGYVYASGYNLAASAQRGNTRLVGVIFGGKTSRSRNAAMAKLLDDGFSAVASHSAVAGKSSQRDLVEAIADNSSGYFSDLADDRTARSPMRDPSVREQGDANITESAARAGGWLVQLGAFSSREAALAVTASARRVLKNIPDENIVLAPLMTSRGMIYRARLQGFTRESAIAACRNLGESCLILSAE